MKNLLIISFLSVLTATGFSTCAQSIYYGSALDAGQQMKESRELAKKVEVKTVKEFENGKDKLCSYYFEELGEEMPFRVCVPENWDGKTKLPLLMFLHGGWSNESVYLDQNNKQLVRLAMQNGYLLVSPMGANEAYGNDLILPAKFGQNDEARKIVEEQHAKRAKAQELSEKDVINVLEIVLANYPVDRRNMFLSGHSMGGGGTWYIGGKYPSYWKALAPMSGPFVLDFGYPWKNIQNKPVYVTEGLKADDSLGASRELRDYMQEHHMNFRYKEFDGDHGGMVPLALPSVFDFFNEQRDGAKPKVKPLTEKDMSAYLMVYFLEHGHNLYFAVSKDGYTFTDVNGGKPVMAGDTLAFQKGIRDPHIYRGPDNAFYLAMTDLHIYAKQEGLRDTEWERDGYGWGNNRALVLMKSKDLIHWTRSNIRVDLSFPGLEDIGCAWAPSTIFDENEGKLMLNFTMRFKDGPNTLYYSYVNDDFTMLLTKPEKLFEHPEDPNYIDSDISKVGDKFHLFYGVGHIKHAESDKINEGYVYEPELCDEEEGACEAPTLWKRIGEDKWVLMYDVFSARPNNMGFSETSDFKHFERIGHFNEGKMKTTNFSSPKHGAVVQITDKEYKRLVNYWGNK